MKRILILIAILLAAATPAALAGEHDDHRPAPAPTDARFEFLRALAGTWLAEDGATDMPAGAMFEFRVTAGGTAIEEREMIGTPMEMVTLYHMEGDDLVATHYCALGNQPRMRAAKQVVDDTLSFACNGKPGNARSHDDEHVHSWTIRRGADGNVHYSAELIKDGKVTGGPELVLTRQSATASR